jgi:hypothetical protein
MCQQRSQPKLNVSRQEVELVETMFENLKFIKIKIHLQLHRIAVGITMKISKTHVHDCPQWFNMCYSL